MLKKLTLLLCVVCLLTLVACKQDAELKKQTSNSTSIQSEMVSDSPDESKDQAVTSGTELEEDVFDDTSKPDSSTQNNQSNDDSSKEEKPKDTVSEKNESTDNTSSDTTSEHPPETEENTSSEEDVVVEDGVVKLPIDRFD